MDDGLVLALLGPGVFNGGAHVIAHSASPSGWAFEPVQTLGLLALGALYTRGCAKAIAAGHRVGWLRPGLFALGWVMLAGALLSPLHSASEVLLSAHMAQHTLLLLAPLALIAGKVGTRSMQALPQRIRGRVARFGIRVSGSGWQIGALVAMAIVVVAWHVPPIFEVAARNTLLHAIEHQSLIGASAFYWMSVVGFGSRRETQFGISLLSIFLLMLLGGVIGGLMTFSTVAWYRGYAASAVELGVDWLADQQLAGLLMWLPMGAVLMGVGAWLAYRWQAMSDALPRSGADRSPTMAGR